MRISLFLVCFSCLFGQLYHPKDFSYLLSLRDFDKELMEMHFTLYRGYVKNTNAVLQDLKNTKKGSQDYFGLKRRFSWEFNGMRLHEFFFENIALEKEFLQKSSPLAEQIIQDFGSVDAWKKDFTQTGLLRGIGWVVLYFDPVQKRLFNSWIDDHNTGELLNADPICVMDVWEHAYITQFGLDRQKYIEIFLNNVSWNILEARFEMQIQDKKSY